MVEETWQFRVKGFRARKDWLVLPVGATLEALHYEIHNKLGVQRWYPDEDGDWEKGAWETEDPDDHAYGFWLDGRAFGGYPYYGNPEHVVYCDDGVLAADVPLADLDLTAKQQIAYVYDFGDPIKFLLTVERVPNRVPA